MLAKRRFQAGFKLWLACSAALAAAVVVAVGLPRLSPSVTMFGFMALVFTMRERVESSAEMVSVECEGLVGDTCLTHLWLEPVFNCQSARW
jgi:hypothetical protein